MHALFDWLDQRLDYRRYANQLRQRVLPDGPSWWYTSASCLFWLLIIECVTGLLLMATYSPSMTSAWASVHFIDQTSAGRFLRGVHHYSSHALIILFAVHVLRVLITGAYRAPRELVWITGLLLFPLVIVWSVTGNPLSASQKGIAQIQVEGSILGATPVIGATLQRLLFGSDEVGNLTLTRLYFLHVGLLPMLVGGLCFVHLYQVIKHSSYRPVESSSDATAATLLPYWPYQSIRNMTTLAVIVGIISLISWRYGAPLYAPADPDLSHSPRPEWYFRWLFELRRYFTGDLEFVATMVVPTALLTAFMAVPILDRIVSVRFRTLCRLLIVAVCGGGCGWLTYLSYSHDANDAEYQAASVEFEKMSARARELALTNPISSDGAVELLRHDPLTQGPRLFAMHCGSCHSFTNDAGFGHVAAEPSAPNLYGIGSRKWILGFLDPDQIADHDHFQKTAFRDGDMVQHLRELFEAAGTDGQLALREKLDAVASALAAEAGQEPPDSPATIRGHELMVGELGCVNCHRFHGQGDLGSAPDLTGYCSSNWLSGMISTPNDQRFYGDRNDRMPAFAADEKHPELNLLSARELNLLVQWMVPSTNHRESKMQSTQVPVPSVNNDSSAQPRPVKLLTGT